MTGKHKPVYTQKTRESVLLLLDKDVTFSQIAQVLCISPATVETIIDDAYQAHKKETSNQRPPYEDEPDAKSPVNNYDKGYMAGVSDMARLDQQGDTFINSVQQPLLEMLVTPGTRPGTLLVKLEIANASLEAMEDVTRKLAMILASHLPI